MHCSNMAHHTITLPCTTFLHHTSFSSSHYTTPPSHTTSHHTTLHYHTPEQHILKSIGGDYDGDLYLLIGDLDIVKSLCAVQGVNFTGGRGAKTRSDNGVEIGLNVCVDNDDVIKSGNNGNIHSAFSSDSNISNGSTREESVISHKLSGIPTSSSSSTSTSVSSVASKTTPLAPKPSSECSQECSLETVVQPSEEHSSPQKTIINFDFNFATCPSPEPGPSHLLQIPSKIPELIQVLPNIEILNLSDEFINENDHDNSNNIYDINNLNDIDNSNDDEDYNNNYNGDSNNYDRNKNNNNNSNNNCNTITCASPVPVSSYLQIPQGIPSRALNLLTTPPSQFTPSEFSEVRNCFKI